MVQTCLCGPEQILGIRIHPDSPKRASCDYFTQSLLRLRYLIRRLWNNLKLSSNGQTVKTHKQQLLRQEYLQQQHRCWSIPVMFSITDWHGSAEQLMENHIRKRRIRPDCMRITTYYRWHFTGKLQSQKNMQLKAKRVLFCSFLWGEKKIAGCIWGTCKRAYMHTKPPLHK